MADEVVAAVSGVRIMNVLVDATPHREVQDLHAAADSQNRHVRGECRPGQRQLRLVAKLRARLALGMRVLAVGRSLDVWTAVQEQGIDRAQGGLGVVGEGLGGRKGDRQRRPPHQCPRRIRPRAG